jgi:hypothetical protein
VHHAIKFLGEQLVKAITESNRMTSATKLMNEAQQKAVESTRKEVFELQTLYAVAKDTSVAYDKRKAAINELNKKYPELHKNLNLENIGNREVAEAIGLVIDKMVKRAQLQNIISQLVEVTQAVEAFQKALKESPNGPISRSLENTIKHYKGVIDELTKKAISLQTDTIGSDANGAKIASQLGAQLSKNKVHIKPEVKITPKKIDYSLINTAAGFDFENALNIYLATKYIKIKPKYTLESPGFTADNTGIEGQDDPTKKLEEMLAAEQAQADLITGVLSPAFEDFFDAITSKQDALRAFFKGIEQSIKRVIAQLIQAAIQASVLSLISGGVSRGGSSFLGNFKKILGFASGGLVTGPVQALVGEGSGTSKSNPEVISPLDKLRGFFADMISPGGSFGGRMGTAGAVFSMPGEIILRAAGRDLYAAIALEIKNQKLTG